MFLKKTIMGGAIALSAGIAGAFALSSANEQIKHQDLAKCETNPTTPACKAMYQIK